jgi:hypothetical protein
MTYLEMVGILGPVALAMRQAVDTPTFKAYHRVLEPVPAQLLRSAADASLEEVDLRFFPSAPDWKGRCETQRRRLLALHPFEPCAKCNGIGQVRTSPVGLVPIRYGPCQCRIDYEGRIERLGLSAKPIAALPPADGEVHHEEPTAPVALPEHVQAKLHEMTRTKVMR